MVAVTAPQSAADRIIAERFVLRELLGEGGMGAVYRAHQLGVGRDVAVKVLRPELARGDAHVTALFFREARAACRLSHPNIVTVYDFGRTEDGTFFIAMELLRGESLTALVQRRQLKLVDVLHIALQVANALGEAHAEGVIHRDVKPDNVIIESRRWDERVAKVLDFGLAKVVGSAVETGRTGVRFGTPLYMSPEQILGKPLDHRADIYSLGVMLYEMLAGRPPYVDRTPVRVCLQHVDNPIPPLNQWDPRVSVSSELEGLVRCMLAKDPAERPQEIREVEAVLRECLAYERSAGPTVLTARPGHVVEATSDQRVERSRSSQLIRLSKQRAAGASDDQGDYTHAVALAAPPGVGLAERSDPQGEITHFVVRSAQRTSDPRRQVARTPEPAGPASRLESAAGVHRASTERIPVTREPSRPSLSLVPDPAPWPASPALRDLGHGVRAGGGRDPEEHGGRYSPPGDPRQRKPRTLRLSPAKGPAAPPPAATVPAEEAPSFADTAEGYARAFLAALGGAAAGWLGYWLLVLR